MGELDGADVAGLLVVQRQTRHNPFLGFTDAQFRTLEADKHGLRAAEEELTLVKILAEEEKTHFFNQTIDRSIEQWIDQPNDQQYRNSFIQYPATGACEVARGTDAEEVAAA